MWSMPSIYGCKCYKVYKHRDKECRPCIVRETFEDGQVRIHEEVVTSRDGRPMNVIVTTAPIRNAVFLVQGIGRDGVGVIHRQQDSPVAWRQHSGEV